LKNQKTRNKRLRDNNTNISSSTTDKRPHNPTSRHKVEAEMKIEEERTKSNKTNDIKPREIRPKNKKIHKTNERYTKQ